MIAARSMRKLLALFMTTLMVFTLLSGCGEEQAAEEAVSRNESAEDFDASPDSLLSVGEAVEGTDGDGLPRLAGFVPFEEEGEFNADLEVKITRSARPIRRITKQDIYGRELSDDFYFYRNLLNDNEKRLYDQIYANAVEMDPYFEITTKVPCERAGPIYLSVRFDNPDLFWMDAYYKYSWDENGNISSMTLQFYDMVNGDIDAFKEQFYACVDSVAEYCMDFSDIEKVRFCHDLLTNLNTYDWGDYNQSAYSALCRGVTVCAGFTHAFTMLMQRLGVPCASIYGEGGDEGPHLWNLVYINDDFYEMDVTWDNPDTYPNRNPHTYYYNYFNIPTSEMSRNHARYEASMLLPTGNDWSYTYANYFGDAPGSDFSGIRYAKPSANLPPLYPDGYDEVVYSEHEDASESESDDSYTRDEVEEIIYNWSDEQWDEFWDYLEQNLSPEEQQEIYDMEWDEFIDLMHYLMSE